MDANIQIQGIKSQIDNMKLQIENIEMQNNNMMNQMMMNPIGDQLSILSIQLLNTGIQTFNFGKSQLINCDKYFEQLKKVSDQINNLINIYNTEKQQQQMIQQQMMQQQMMQQQMMQQQMMAQQQMINPIKIFFSFQTPLGYIYMTVDSYITIKELNDKFREKLKNLQNKYKYKYKDYYLIYNAKKIDKNSQMTVMDYFKSCLVKITVLFS